MSDPVLLAQLSDPHLGAEWAGPDPGADLRAAVESVRSLRPRPAAVLISGDLSDRASDADYEQVRDLVALDTTRPGEDAGMLDTELLDWLDAELAAVPQVPTVLAMHHPPLVTGVPAWDGICLSASDRRALREVLERHHQVRRLVAGHLHCTIIGEFAGRVVLTVPSTYVQARHEFGARKT